MKHNAHSLKRLLLLAALFATAPFTASAQTDSIVSMSDDLSLLPPKSIRSQADTLQKWEYHLSMGGAVVGSSFGSASLYGIKPTVIFKPNDKLKVSASASLLNSFSFGASSYTLRGSNPRSLAPLRNYNAAAAALEVAATYKVNDRLWVAASLLHIGGGLASGVIINPWMLGNSPVMLDATAFSAAMRYRIGKDNYLDLQMTIIDDRTGAFGPLFFGGPYGSTMYYRNTTFGGHLF
ncbi:MAG: hypothetical protein IKP34_07295 [Bacteroidales bacterium]|nr:hypothetical protein [Bacteroidales bacterium]